MLFVKNKKNSFLFKLSLILSCLFFSSSVLANNFVYQFVPEDFTSTEFMQLRHISSLGIGTQKVNGLAVNELSGLGWDEHKKLLYAVSDSGVLYHIRPIVKQGKLLEAKVLQAYQLKDKKGRVLKGKYRDAEGLSLKRNQQGRVTELIISFERKFRVVRFDLQGKFLGNIRLPKTLRKKKNYQSKNKGLESVTLHPKWGIITAPERPLKIAPPHYHTLYSNKGQLWHFKESLHRNSSVTGLETLPNGNILVLERSYNGLFSAMVISLRQVKLSACNQQRQCEVVDIAVFNSLDGWRIDNFEGLTHYRGNQYFMVSDDNESPLQSTVLVLFEIKE